MLVRMKKNAFDKYNKDNKLKAGDLVEVANESRAKTMIKVGMAEAVKVKTLTEPVKEEPKEEANESAEAEVVKKVVTRRSKAGAEDQE